MSPAVPVPSRRRILSVRSRIVVWMLLVSAFGLAASGIASYLVQRDSVLTAIDTKLLRAVDDVQDIARGATSGDTPASVPNTALDPDTAIPLTSVEQVLHTAMRQLVPSANESMLGFVDGTPTPTWSALPPFRIDDSPDLVTRLLAEANANGIVLGTARTLTDPTTTTDAPRGPDTAFPATVRYIIIPVQVRGDERAGLFAVAFDVDAELAAVTHSLDTYARVALGALVLVGLVAWLVAGRLLRPIRLLRDAAVGSNSAADLVERIPVTGHDDVSNLAEAINGMFDRLHGSSLSQQRLLDDIGHELKTPITIIRGQLEVLDASRQSEVEATRALAIDELDRMSSLLAGISLLAQSRAPHFVELATLDLADFTAAVGAKASALDPTRLWTVSCSSATTPRSTADAPSFQNSPVTVSIDADRITQAWLQLAANAVRHSTPGGAIALTSLVSTTRPSGFTHAVPHEPGPAGSLGSVRPAEPSTATAGLGPSEPGPDPAARPWPPERWLSLSVRDAGPGIRLQAQPRIFDRFGRVENARGAEGAGLGLSIVAAIAHAHGGTVQLDSAAGSASTFTIVVPAGRPVDPPRVTNPTPDFASTSTSTQGSTP
ncbi:HAMP domain-containing histidine kinase [Cryobacterium frigoriphilum]|uniref:histidine kinase n=1 Tax=Cryobacterium frigoriphilum TaxID=1259150 RepID=A0A4V3IQK9_9MICO|nr:HAMP domain-containing sensor histidine kinase [Cryobacterium frigoriphilum]TFD47318.1 HAMP domain-containing histidine kinase [Cryobacterium frigoriphilum]